jgi:hypothetical protein
METLFDFFFSILYLVMVLMPVAVPGPIASLFLISYAKKENLSIVHLVLLFIADGLSILFIIASQYSRIYDFVFCLTPIAIAGSLLILGGSWKTLSQIGKENVKFQKQINVGIFLIFFLQIIVFLVAGTNLSE